MAEELPLSSVSGHLEEFRRRLIRCLLLFMCLFPVAWPFSSPFIEWIQRTLCPPEMGTMYYTAPMELFFLRMKISFIGALVGELPFLIWQIAAYVAPALYRRERMTAIVMSALSVMLFLFGAALALFFIFPLLMQFSIGMQTEGVKPLISASSCIGMAALLMLSFGIVFQLPIVILLLLRMGVCSVHTLRHMRPYIIVGIFIVAGILTPPDVISQLTLALPACLLFELSLIAGKRLERSSRENSESGA